MDSQSAQQEKSSVAPTAAFSSFDALRGQSNPESVSIRRSGEKEIHDEGQMKEQNQDTGNWDKSYKTAFHCPSGPHSDYLLELQQEIARNYKILALLNDYIRYNSPDCCFCERCQAKYAEYSGNPESLSALSRKPSWWEFRTDLIEDFSRRRSVRKPGLQLITWGETPTIMM